jgi:aldose 1-epimerase
MTLQCGTIPLPAGGGGAGVRLRNRAGVEADVIAPGATLRALRLPSPGGDLVDVVLGPEGTEDSRRGRDCFGATIGRFANRIAHGRFVIGGHDVRLPVNAPPHSEHGGEDGFDRRVWNVGPTGGGDGASVELTLASPDGDQGFPGLLEVRVRYALTDANELRIDYRAVSDAPTVVNLTNHSYWNLAGSGSALPHRLGIDADEFLPVDATLLPTGERRPVKGTPFDFREPAVIADRIRAPGDEQLRRAAGFDHCYILRGAAGVLRPAATLEDPGSGRRLEILTTEPGLQLYTGNAFAPGLIGKRGRCYRAGDGIALETQHFPDSPNHPEFPSTVLAPGQVYESTTVYRLTAGRAGFCA